MLTNEIAYVGRLVLDHLDGFGRFTRFALSAAAWTFRPARGFGRLRLLIPQFYAIGTLSIPVVAAVGAFVGAVMAVEMFSQFAAIGQESRVGGIIHISVVKQIGPVLAAVMVAGRVGGAVSAELGTMHVTEQLDALRVMGADPVSYLVVPRVIACVLMLPVLTVFSDLLGIFGGYFITVGAFGVNAEAYWEFSAIFVTSWDVYTGLFKSVVFGLAIGLISCYKGFYCEAGAAGVGRATTDSFVTSFIVIIVSNLFLAMFFRDMYTLIYGYGGPTAFSG